MRRLLAAVAVVATACSGASKATTSTAPPLPTTTTSTALTTTSTASAFPATTLPAGYGVTWQTTALEGEGWTASVPELSLEHPQAAVVRAVEEALRDLVASIVDAFVVGGGAGALDVEPEVTFLSAEALSVRLIGRGPGLLLADTASFDLVTGRPLSLTDVLVGANSILLVSDRVTAALVAEVHGGEPESLRAYTEAVNPRTIAYSAAGLEVSFDPGEVAAFETGLVTVLVPWGDVAEFIGPEGPFAPLRADL